MTLEYLHNRKDFKQLLEITARANRIDDVSLVEKDYWIMHSLYGLQKAELTFDLKGGTSLSKGYQIINRFSEDIDIKIYPDEKKVGFTVYEGQNQEKEKHVQSRKKYFDWLAQYIQSKLPEIESVERDEQYDDKGKYRNGGIRLIYKPLFRTTPGLKSGILLEVGFDQTNPFKEIDISSWAYEIAKQSNSIQFIDNRGKKIHCYDFRYTFVEKLQAIIKKFRQFNESNNKTMPNNFVRHYYDIYCLIQLPEIQSFIGTQEYLDHKIKRFKSENLDIAQSDAFYLKQNGIKTLFENAFNSSSLYYKERPTFIVLLSEIQKFVNIL